jgi:acyl carrier protein
MSEMQEKIIAAVADILGLDAALIQPDTDRETLSVWDSLAHLQIISEVEDRLGVKIPFEAVAQIRCVRDFEKYIR